MRITLSVLMFAGMNVAAATEIHPCALEDGTFAHHVVPPELFCASREVTLEYWRDSIPYKACILPSECDARTINRLSEVRVESAA